MLRMSSFNAPARADLQELLKLMPFSATLGVVFDAADAAEVRGRLAWSHERCTAGA